MINHFIWVRACKESDLEPSQKHWAQVWDTPQMRSQFIARHGQSCTFSPPTGMFSAGWTKSCKHVRNNMLNFIILMLIHNMYKPSNLKRPQNMDIYKPKQGGPGPLTINVLISVQFNKFIYSTILLKYKFVLYIYYVLYILRIK